MWFCRPGQIVIGWGVAIAAGALAGCGPYHMSYPSYQYRPREAALYNALSPILWGAFLGWITFADSIGHAGTQVFMPRSESDAGRCRVTPPLGS
jgi:hypothetical protein